MHPDLVMLDPSSPGVTKRSMIDWMQIYHPFVTIDASAKFHEIAEIVRRAQPKFFPDPSSKAPARDEGEWTTKTCAFSWAIETTVPTVLKALISSLPHTMRSWFCSNPRLRSRRGNSALASENASAWPSSSAMADFHQGVKRSACADLDNRPQKRNAQTSAGNVSPEDHNSMDLFDDDWGTEDAVHGKDIREPPNLTGSTSAEETVSSSPKKSQLFQEEDQRLPALETSVARLESGLQVLREAFSAEKLILERERAENEELKKKLESLSSLKPRLAVVEARLENLSRLVTASLKTFVNASAGLNAFLNAS